MEVSNTNVTVKNFEEKGTFTRPPVVVLLGHVDHGKTTLLDSLSGSKFAREEFGEITQNIRAAEVETKFGKITFIDTPGHAYFHNFREYGVKFADIALLVVSATEGVREQTRESIKLVAEAKIPMICVISKIDLAQGNTVKVKKQLAEAGILIEGASDNIPVVEVSATQKIGIDDLVETISILATLSNFQSRLNTKAMGVVLESFLDKKAGPLLLVLTKDGILTKGAQIRVDGISGKIRAIFTNDGKPINKAYPGQPVKILGLASLVPAGFQIRQDGYKNPTAPAPNTNKKVSISDREAAKKNLGIILKADSAGSKEAILANLPKDLTVVDAGVGAITASDVEKAVSVGAQIYGFNVDVTSDVTRLLKNYKNLFFKSQLIYELIDEIAKAATSYQKKEEKVLGVGKIVKSFNLDGLKIAGCQVIDGILTTGGRVKIFRGEKEIGESKIASIKQFTKLQKKVIKGSECGVGFTEPVDFQAGDVLKFVA